MANDKKTIALKDFWEENRRAIISFCFLVCTFALIDMFSLGVSKIQADECRYLYISVKNNQNREDYKQFENVI